MLTRTILILELHEDLSSPTIHSKVLLKFLPQRPVNASQSTFFDSAAAFIPPSKDRKNDPTDRTHSAIDFIAFSILRVDASVPSETGSKVKCLVVDQAH